MVTPAVPSMPLAPNLAAQWPPTIVLTPEWAATYKEACDAYTVEGQNFIEEEIQLEFGLTRNDACEWVLVGHTVQGALNVESMWSQVVTYVQQLIQAVETRNAIIKNMVEVSSKVNEINKGE